MITVNKKTMDPKRKTLPQRVDMTGDIAFSPGSVEEKLEKLLQKYPDNERALLLAKKLKARKKMSKELINYTISPRFEHESFERSLSLGSISKLNIRALHGSNNDTLSKANYFSRSNVEQKDHLTDLYVNCKEGTTDKSLNEIKKETVASTNKFIDICETNTNTSRVGELLEYIEEKYGNRENPVSEHPIDDCKMEGSKPSTELQYNNSIINASSKIIQSKTSLKENRGTDDQQSLRSVLNGIKNDQSTGVKQNSERQTVRSCKSKASDRILNNEKSIRKVIPIEDKIIKVYPPVQKKDSKMRMGNISTTKKKVSSASSWKSSISCSMEETRECNTNNAEDIAGTKQDTNTNDMMQQKIDASDESRRKENILLNKKQLFGSEADYHTVVSMLLSDATEDAVSKLLVPAGFVGEKKDDSDDELTREDGSYSKNSINRLRRLCILLGIILLIVIGIIGLGVILGFVVAKWSKAE
mmetsp:Transcript_47820/g.51689  ORF Transcript_47820/g.51689 Transcript_47820/m.51689 type:complete len:472 (+) Transcript_47820:102-1517(+)